MLKRVAAAAVGLLAVAGVVGLPASSATAADPCSTPVVNKVACENTRAGTPETTWRVEDNDDSIVGYSTDMSTNVGGTVQFKVKTTARAYTIDVYRLGWYGGSGARKMATVTPSAPLPQTQPACLTEASTGLYDCGNWGVSASWAVPATAVSGLYYAVLHRTDTGGENEVFFVVRDDASTSALYFQTSDQTWQAYNRYGGNSLYTGTGPGDAGSAYKVSYNRPISGAGEENMPFNAEVPAIRFLESNGYDISYGSGIDSDRYGSLLTRHRVYLSVGHDEYWTGNQRANVEAAKAAGVNLAFLSGNGAFWKTRLAPSIAAGAAANRTLVCYKETKANAKTDPSPEWTGSWRDPRFSPPSDGGRPENALMGQQFLVNGYRKDALQVPAAYGRMRLWRGTSLTSMPAGSTATFAPGTLGYEWDSYVDNGSQPPGVARLSSTTVTMTDGQYILKNYGDDYGMGTATNYLTEYKDQSSGALVFATGSAQWSWGLDDYHNFTDDAYGTADVRIQQAMVNVLADMGVSASTLRAGLTQTAASTDTVAPTATINDPATPVVGATTTLTGSVTDSGGGTVAGVEVSVDGGATWHPATWQVGTSAWSYPVTPTGSGALTVKVRAVDDSANLSVPVSRQLTVASRPCPCSIWTADTVPGTTSANDSSALELGVKFRSATAGWVSGVKFYKGAGNTGAHTGSLWSASGQLLATGTFTNETATGWQTLVFGVPVKITAGTTYVASYHTTTGHYAADSGYFASTGHSNEPLTALQTGVDGANGVYRGGASGFPTDSYNAANYWVDVVFGDTAPADTAPPTAASTSPASGTPSVRPTTAVTATFNEPVRPAGLTFTLAAGSTTAAGSVTLDSAGTTAAFTPAAALAGGTTYTATVRATDLAGNQQAAAYSWTFTTGTPRAATCPCTVWDDFAAPATANTADPGALELGTKVRFDTAGYVLGVRFYKGSQNTGTHTGTLWTAGGQQLATGTFTGETASGWQTLTFASPVRVAANTVYVVSYHTNTGYYSSSPGYFAGASADYQALHALADGGSTGGNGVFSYGSGGFPTGSYNATNYWVDAVWTNSVAGDTTPPTVTGGDPYDGAVNVSATAPLTAVFSEPVDPATLAFTLNDGGGAALDGTVAYDAGARTASFTPKAALSAGETYSARVRASDTEGNAMAAAQLRIFTVSKTRTCPCTLFSDASHPSVESSADSGAYQLGVRFTSETAGQVTAVRFWKGPGNTGTHTGSLWTADGQLLATGTFVNETATGWQTLVFADPVAIQATTMYVASYTVLHGGYAADAGYFEAGEATGVPLHASATGGGLYNGVYAVGSGYPTESYRGANYWVDVVVAPPAANTVTAEGPAADGTPTRAVVPEQPSAVVERQRSRTTVKRVTHRSR